MKKNHFGFSAVEMVVILVVAVGLSGVGYKIYKNHHQSQPASSTKSAQIKTDSSVNSDVQSIDSILSQQGSGESAIDAQGTNSDVSAGQSANSAANNLGGAYNENNF